MFQGVKIYSTSLKRIITYINKDHEASLRDELYRCSLLWAEQDCLIIGWADRFKICRVVRSSRAAATAAPTNQSSQARKLSSITNVLTSGALDKATDTGAHVEISKNHLCRVDLQSSLDLALSAAFSRLPRSKLEISQL